MSEPGRFARGAGRRTTFEHKWAPLLPRRAFAWRMLGHALFAVAFVAGSLAIGVWGYHHFERMPYIDALLNASMLLGGMGPVGDLHTVGGKLFASAYALFAGIGFLVVAGLLFAPIIHRFLHKFHLEMAPDPGSPEKDLPGRQTYRADRGRPFRTNPRSVHPEPGSDSSES